MSRHLVKLARRRKERRRRKDRIGGLKAKDAAKARERMAIAMAHYDNVLTKSGGK